MPEIRIATSDLQRMLWPGEHYRVRIKGSAYSAGDDTIVFTVAGEELPEADELIPIVTRWEETQFTVKR